MNSQDIGLGIIWVALILTELALLGGSVFFFRVTWRDRDGVALSLGIFLLIGFLALVAIMLIIPPTVEQIIGEVVIWKIA